MTEVYKRYSYLLLLFLLLNGGCLSFAQDYHRIEGVITDSITGEQLAGVHLITSGKTVEATTDSTGHYLGRFKHGNVSLCASLFGYKKKCISLFLSENKKFDMTLSPDVIEGKEIIVINKRPELAKSAEMGTIELNRKTIEALPSFAGEKDIMRMLQLTPGVSKSESTLGINVRGGASDQTLILLDGATIYNPSHLMGFFSVFNPMTISNLKLIKAGLPANYGGRLSSVLEVETQKKNSSSVEGSCNVGLYTSSAVISCPVIKDKLVITVAGRKTYFDELFKPVTKIVVPTSVFNDLSYGFYDLNAGILYQASTSDKIFCSFYKGNDAFSLNIKSLAVNNGMNWGNDALSVTWNHAENSFFSLKQNLVYSDYNFTFDVIQDKLNFHLLSKVKNFGYNSEYNFYFENQSIKAGVQLAYIQVMPNMSQASADDLVADFGTPNIYNTFQATAFLNDEIKIGKKFLINAGFRYSYYMHIGKYEQFNRDFTGKIIDTTFYGTRDIVAAFSLPEPRISLRYLLSENSSLKFAFTRHYQTLQQVNVSAISMPSDFWIPATKSLKPQSGYQISLGYYKNIRNNDYEFSVESYYKEMNNQVEFKNGILNILSKESTEENLLLGNGWSYGTEFYFKKNAGRTTGWISYTISRTLRQFDEINSGNPFPAKYDRIHDLSLVLNYKLNEKWTFAGIFVYATGNALTLPIGRYIIQQNIVNEYGDYNSFRMPAYHRLDISATKQLKKTARYESAIEFSVVNVYNRQNPIYTFIESRGDLEKYSVDIKARQIAILPILPSVNWIIKF